MSEQRPAPPNRSAFVSFINVPTRWADNDVYGHVNNTVYYSYFDTAVNQWLISAGLLDTGSADSDAPIGLVVANSCLFFSSVSFPQALSIGLRLEHMGNSSVRYALGVFAENAPTAAALGEFTHVYVNRHTRKPEPLPALWRIQLSRLIQPKLTTNQP